MTNFWYGLHEFYFKSCDEITDNDIQKIIEEIKGEEKNVIITITNGLTTMTDVIYVAGERAMSENIEFGKIEKGNFFDLLKSIVLGDAKADEEVYVSVHNIPWSPDIIKKFLGG